MIVATLFQYFAARMDLETVEPAFVDIDIRTELSVIGIEHSGACALGAIQLGMCASQCREKLGCMVLDQQPVHRQTRKTEDP